MLYTDIIAEFFSDVKAELYCAGMDGMCAVSPKNKSFMQVISYQSD